MRTKHAERTSVGSCDNFHTNKHLKEVNTMLAGRRGRKGMLGP